jgi:hypothetical protein
VPKGMLPRGAGLVVAIIATVALLGQFYPEFPERLGSLARILCMVVSLGLGAYLNLFTKDS